MSEQNLSPPEEKNKPTVDKSEEVVVISKVTFNYIVIAITFLVVGIVIGVFGLDRDEKDETAMLVSTKISCVRF